MVTGNNILRFPQSPETCSITYHNVSRTPKTTFKRTIILINQALCDSGSGSSSASNYVGESLKPSNLKELAKTKKKRQIRTPGRQHRSNHNLFLRYVHRPYVSTLFAFVDFSLLVFFLPVRFFLKTCSLTSFL